MLPGDGVTVAKTIVEREGSILPCLFAELFPRTIVFHWLLFPVLDDKLKFPGLPRERGLMVKYVQMLVLRDGHQAQRNIR